MSGNRTLADYISYMRLSTKKACITTSLTLQNEPDTLRNLTASKKVQLWIFKQRIRKNIKLMPVLNK